MKIRSILIIIQRSNGDVFFSLSLINALYKFYKSPKIDLLVNDDTISLAKTLPNIGLIHTFSYQKKKENRFDQEKKLVERIYRKYDLSINLTSSDRSVMYAVFASKFSISAVEKNVIKSWWKKLFLKKYYFFNNSKHILLNNLEPLNLLDIEHIKKQESPPLSNLSITRVKQKLHSQGINDFVIFHPSAQYEYKIYPKHLRDELLIKLDKLNIPIVITGGNTDIDKDIKSQLPSLSNIYDFIGETTLEEYLSLSSLSLAYIGMDTLNMHIAASQDKRIFAIFGPTNLSTWSPWSNFSMHCAEKNMPIQTYDNVTIFQANLPCVACGKAGCDDKHGKSNCLFEIQPKIIFQEINKWHSCIEVSSG